MMHLDKDSAAPVKGKAMVNTKCGKTVPRPESTIWWRDVDCTNCVPNRFVPANDGLGLQMKNVQGRKVLRRRPVETTPQVKVIRRRG